MNIEFSVAQENLRKIVEEYSPLGELSNEAQTRFSFIDRLLQECLGWPNILIRVEVSEGGERSDYECGAPRSLIVEAKRSSRPFDFPPRGVRRQNRLRLDSIISYSEEAAAAIKQAQSYCQGRGVELAAVSNGSQLVVFLATRTDGQPPLAGECCVFDGYEDLILNFTQVFELLSFAGVSGYRYREFLDAKPAQALPTKLAATCLDYYSFNYANAFQESLKNAASLVIEDLGRSGSVEKEFLADCYCESGPLSQYSLLGKNILVSRYAALFAPGVSKSHLDPINPRKGTKEEFSSKVLAEAMARRPLILIGDVGVGKTSFLKHLIQVSASEVFKDAVAIYFDLGSKAALSSTPKDALLDQIELVIRKDLGANKADVGILEAVYVDDLTDFDGGLMAGLKDVDPPKFLAKRIELLEGLMARREVHLRLVLAHLAHKQGRQVVFIIDNADQRSPEVQSEAFLIAQELCASWDAIVFIALRPQTFHGSKRSGAVSAYPSKVFVIPPPKLEEAIDKRLAFAQRIAEGHIPVQGLAGVTLHLDSLVVLIRCLRRSFHKNPELLEFLVNISAGNIRLAVELVARFFGNPNVQSEKIVRIESEGNEYVIPVHEFAKTALLGDYSHFQEASSVASNVFSVDFADPREHFLSLYILGYLTWSGVPGGSGDGFVLLSDIVDEMQKLGYRPEQVQAHVVRLTRKKLLEAAERRNLESEEELRAHGMPDVFRATSLGAYVSKKWSSEFSYLEAMSYDTPLMDSELRTELAKSVNDDRLHSRYERAKGFRDYLSNIWQQMDSKPFFDWNQLVVASCDSFTRVEKRLAELGLAG